MKDLEPILEHMKKSRAQLFAIAAAIPERRWRESPGGGAWSAGEVIAHLKMVEERVIQGTREVLQKAPQPVPLLKRIHAPVPLTAWRGVRRKSPIPLDPHLVVEKQAALDELSATRSATLEFIESVKGSDLSPYRFPHPFLGSLDIYDWFRMLGYHEIRHAKQIREIVKKFQR